MQAARLFRDLNRCGKGVSGSHVHSQAHLSLGTPDWMGEAGAEEGAGAGGGGRWVGWLGGRSSCEAG